MKTPKPDCRPPFLTATCLIITSLLCARGYAGHPYDKHSLHSAIKKGDTKKSLALIKQGKRINDREYYTMSAETPLYRAAFEGQEEVVAALLKAGADVDLEEERHGALPLHMAVANGHAGTTRLLLAAGANVGARDDSGCTPFILVPSSATLSSYECSSTTVQMLVRRTRTAYLL